MSQATTIPIDPEACRLLAAIAKLPDKIPPAHIASIAAQVANWNSLIELAQEHRVLPLLYSRLLECRAEIPTDALEKIRVLCEHNILRSMANAAELIDLLREFNQAAIAALPFKGVVLSAALYHDLTLRTAGDLDFLITHSDLQAATDILIARGYRRVTPKIPAHQQKFSDNSEESFLRDSDGMVAELRWKLGLQKFTRDLGLNWLWPKRTTTLVAGAEIPNLDPESMLIVLCMHGAKHVWSRLIWICDVAQLLFTHPNLNWPAVLKESKRLGLDRTLSLGVMLAHKISGIEIPQPVLQHLKADHVVRELSEHIAQNLFLAPGTTPPCRIPYILRLLNFRDRLRALFSVQILQPNERDNAFLRLPESLYFLYYLVRPVRILLDRAPRF